MPTYEYRCQDCGNTVEAMQSFSDPPLTVCGACGGRLRRVFHPVGIVLKGSGFYSTDNRSGKRTVSPGKEDGSKPATGSGDTKTSASGSGESPAKGTKGDGSSKGDGGSKGDRGSKGDGGSKGNGGSKGSSGSGSKAS